MFKRTTFRILDFFCFLFLIGIAASLTIDSQLQVIKNDCYERMAIGERLDSKDVYKVLDLNTVQDCQIACTKEGEICRTFSFGIGPKGNASCELSTKVVKETIDLKPIGTVSDPDFDLYIKKLGCTLVINKGPHALKPTVETTISLNTNSDDQTYTTNAPPLNNNYGTPPTTEKIRPNDKQPSNQFFTPEGSTFSTNQDGTYHVQTLVAVRPALPGSLYEGHHTPTIVENNYPLNYDHGKPLEPLGYVYDKPGYESFDYFNKFDHHQHHYYEYSTDFTGHHSQENSYLFRPLDRYGPSEERPHIRPDDRPGSSGYDELNERPPNRPINPPKPEDYAHNDKRPLKRPADVFYPRPEYFDLDFRDDERSSFRPRPLSKPHNYGPSKGELIPDYVRPQERPPYKRVPYYDRIHTDREHYNRPYNRPIDERPYPSYLDERPNLDKKPLSSLTNERPLSSSDRRPNPNNLDKRPTSSFYERPHLTSFYKRPFPHSFHERPSLPSFYERPHTATFEHDRPYSRPEENNYPMVHGGSYLRPETNRYHLTYNGDYSESSYSDSGFNKRPEVDSRPTIDKQYGSPYGYENRPYRPTYGSRPFNDDHFLEGGESYDPFFKGHRRPGYSNTYKPFESNRRYDNGNNKNVNNSIPNKVSSERDRPQYFKPKNESSNVDKLMGNGTKNLSNDEKSKIMYGGNRVVSHSLSLNGQRVTSIITELVDACFRRALAGKRVSRAFVRRAITCERVEDCQRECADEKNFVCEGFNYRLDPTGRGQGDCELLELPLSRLDLRRDLYSDPEYDYYERDRNTSPDCKYHYDDRRYHTGDRNHYGNRRVGYDSPYDRRRPPWNNYYDDYDWRHYSRRRGGKSQDIPLEHRPGVDRTRYDPSNQFRYGYHYPSSLPRYKPYDSYRPTYHSYRPVHDPRDRYFVERQRDRNYWGFKEYRWGSYGGPYGNFGKPDSYYGNYDYLRRRDKNVGHYDHTDRRYLPPNVGGTKDWGKYGGSYGNGGNQIIYLGFKDSYDYWGFDRKDHVYDHHYVERPPYRGRPALDGTYLPAKEGSYFPVDSYGNHLDPAGHSGTGLTPWGENGHNVLKDECSLRSATGFRLHKLIVKKYYAVPNIYECELLCYKEKDFVCKSYAFRYTITLSAPSDNCYLSDRSYKALDFYTDLEPDRDFDIYTMNNPNTCEQPMVKALDHSDCFWRVRSGQRLDHSVVRDSLNVHSIVDCQLECLRSVRFTCRAFSYRYGAAVFGGAIDNCQLTDWPYLELDPRKHIIPEPGFELYDRGSFGHGCEPDHFAIRGKRPPQIGAKTDQLCYVGYGTSARLLPSAIRKSVYADTEFACKAECTRTRQETLLQCMSLSYRTNAPKGAPNCDLSDILQRDLLSEVDYTADRDSWLFAWDNYNPECINLAFDHNFHKVPVLDNGIEGRIDFDPIYPIDVWRVFSVSGLPCRRGSLCKENREAGFWFCELEGGDAGSWDYCCRPDHQCGYSEGFTYQWCYVGPAKTQWRKCSDRYYPYLHHFIDRHDQSYEPGYTVTRPKQPWLPAPPPIDPPNLQPPLRPGFRPDRPPAKQKPPSLKPSLNEYEAQFNQQFLEPPKPGGLGQPRHWPISYLHKEMPPNETVALSPPPLKMDRIQFAKKLNPKFEAIQNLIDIIKSNDLNNIQYQITNESNKADDILYVKIPLPNNITDGPKSENMVKPDGKTTLLDFDDIDIFLPKKDVSKVDNNTDKSFLTRSVKDPTIHNFFNPYPSEIKPTATIVPVKKIKSSSLKMNHSSSVVNSNRNETKRASRPPVYRRSYITKTNVTNHGRNNRIK